MLEMVRSIHQYYFSFANLLLPEYLHEMKVLLQAPWVSLHVPGSSVPPTLSPLSDGNVTALSLSSQTASRTAIQPPNAWLSTPAPDLHLLESRCTIIPCRTFCSYLRYQLLKPSKVLCSWNFPDARIQHPSPSDAPNNHSSLPYAAFEGVEEV